MNRRPDTVIIDNLRVRRIAHDGSETIQALLRHFRREGLDFVPQPLSLDGELEELSYVPGLCYGPTARRPPEAWQVDTIEALGRALRRCHDASVPFLDQHGAAPWFPFAEPCAEPEVICHNDVGPWNIPVDIGRVGIIDWEMASPGKRIWDVAHAAWNWIPMYPPRGRAEVGAPETWDFEARLARLLTSYGEVGWTKTMLLDAVAERQARVLDLVDLARTSGAMLLQNWASVDVQPIQYDQHFTDMLRSGAL